MYTFGARFASMRERNPDKQFKTVIDQFVDRSLSSGGMNADWLSGLRPTDECMPFIPIFPKRMSADALRFFRGRIFHPNSTTVGYAIRPRPNSEEFLARQRDAISDHALVFSTTHPDREVTQVLFHLMTKPSAPTGRQEVWRREHLYSAPDPRYLGVSHPQVPTQEFIDTTQADYRERIGVPGGRLLEDYNWDPMDNTVPGSHGMPAEHCAPNRMKVVGSLARLLTTATLPEMI